DFRRLDFEHFTDFMADIGEAALVAFETLLGARRLLARVSHGFERVARVAVGLRQRVLALRQTIGGGAASGLRGLDLADQCKPLLRKDARSVLETRAFGLGLLDARRQGLD